MIDNFHKELSTNGKQNEPGLVAHLCNPSYLEGEISFKASPGK
jgi:hypothetical protein